MGSNRHTEAPRLASEIERDAAIKEVKQLKELNRYYMARNTKLVADMALIKGAVETDDKRLEKYTALRTAMGNLLKYPNLRTYVGSILFDAAERAMGETK